ncbi:MAG: PH domain-containing protein [Patescibacteria group bacterium]
MPTLFEAPQKAKSHKHVHAPHGQSKMRPLTSFAVNPDGIRFETQEAEEEVILFLRQHFIVNIPWIFIAIVFLIAPTVLLPLIFRSLPISLPATYAVVITLSWYVATAGFVLASFLHWYFNIYIVTNERIVDIDFQYLLFKRFSQAELERIQDISYSSSGIFATIFHYGNVYIQTAGAAPNIEFLAVPSPDKAVENIRSITESLPGAI